MKSHGQDVFVIKIFFYILYDDKYITIFMVQNN